MMHTPQKRRKLREGLEEPLFNMGSSPFSCIEKGIRDELDMFGNKYSLVEESPPWFRNSAGEKERQTEEQSMDLDRTQMLE